MTSSDLKWLLIDPLEKFNRYGNFWILIHKSKWIFHQIKVQMSIRELIMIRLFLASGSKWISPIFDGVWSTPCYANDEKFLNDTFNWNYTHVLWETLSVTLKLSILNSPPEFIFDQNLSLDLSRALRTKTKTNNIIFKKYF